MSTIENLIANASKIEASKQGIKRTTKSVIIKRLEKLGIGEIIIEKPSTNILIGAKERQGMDASFYTLTQSMVSPDLGNLDLQKAFKVNNKVALLKKIFTNEEIEDLIYVVGSMVMEQNTIKPVLEIKN
ncbi:MAG: phage tail assembly chaperone [Cetobacterium sp.]|uniref:phage tail assembly chaperone n=1 Tax=Cetobacterium sp. TaxID=2071632 RepID=UPI003F3F1266